MKSKPISAYPQPAYPTSEQVLAEGCNRLLENLPPAWRRESDKLSLFCLLITVGLTGCGSEFRPCVMPAPVLKQANAADMPLEIPAPVGLVVAPVFEHGEGTGALGCIVVSPPAFMSEEEAMTVITAELRRYGIVLDRKHVKWENALRVESSSSDLEAEPETTSSKPLPAKPLVVTGVDSSKHVAVQYVWMRHDPGADPSERLSTVSVFDFKRSSQRLVEMLAPDAGQNAYVAVFYDPAVKRPERQASKQSAEDFQQQHGEERATAHHSGQTLLRAQVEDFVAWLRTQGAR